MNKKKAIIILNTYWLKEFIDEAILPINLKNVEIIINKKDQSIFKYLKKNKIDIKIHVTKKITSKWFKNTFDIKNSILISAGSPWLISSDIINIFKKNILGIHQSPLPSMRGAVASYIRLFEIRALQTCLFVITSKIDEGKIALKKDIYIGKEHDTPFKINNYLQKHNRELLKDFLYSYFVKKTKIQYTEQNNFFSSYMPRLKTNINGWIDWSLNVYELDRFICAFDNPYPGAQTMLHGKKVNFFNVEMSCADPSKHTFERGMVLRKFKDKIVISVNGGSLYVGKILLNGKDIFHKVKPGDIFYTKANKLDLIKRKNIFVKDSEIYTNQLKIKKI